MKTQLIKFVAALTFVFSAFAHADNATIALAVGGYDLTSYHKGHPVRGNGHHLAVYKGNQYAFANADNKAKFEADPENFLPQYGGYCAYGASLGKKFYGDPTVYEVVEGKLYLNLDKKIQGLWSEAKQKNIAAADKLWPGIKYVPAAEL